MTHVCSRLLAAGSTPLALPLPLQLSPADVRRMTVRVDVLDYCFATTAWQSTSSAREALGPVTWAALLTHRVHPPLAAHPQRTTLPFAACGTTFLKPTRPSR
jgi:hypothetical protein